MISIPETSEVMNYSNCYPSRQGWKCNFVEGEKADPSIIDMAIFYRNTLKLVLHSFQFNP
jgi:hypothetical protein